VPRAYAHALGCLSLSLAAILGCDRKSPEPPAVEKESAKEAPHPPPVVLKATLPPRPPRTFVGSSRCGECHAKQESAWKHDWHRRALSSPSADTVVGTFAGAHFKGASSEATMRTVTGKRVMQTLGTDGNTADFSVDWVIGGKRMQDTVHVFPDGRFQVLPVYFHVTGRGEWVDYTETKQGQLTPQHPFFWANFRRMANRECLDCHTTGLTVDYRAETHDWTTRFAEPGVACESCHGSGATHAESLDPKDIFNPATAKREERTAVCAQCHGPRDPLFPILDAGERFRPGERYEDSYDPVVVLIGGNLSGDYFVDGRPQTSSFEYQAMIQSQCFRKSDLTCLTCHTAPHGGGAPDELRKPKATTAELADASCKSCHQEVSAKGTDHTHHRSATCVSCHMPPTVSGVLDHFADHAIDIPNPDNTARHGVPNACTVCHAGKTPTDLQTSFATMWPSAGARERRRVRLADAFDRDTEAKSREPLAAVAADADEAPSLRGAAIVLLAQRFRGDAARVAEPLLTHESPLLRAKAANALGMASAQGSREALAKALGDTSVPVVQAAAVALTSLNDPRGVEALQRLSGDPRLSHLLTAQFSLAIQKMRTKDPSGAIPVLEKVIALAPYHVEALVMLADALVRTGRRAEAKSRLEDALRFDPQHKGAAERLHALDAP
jgi:hypothetical protein